VKRPDSNDSSRVHLVDGRYSIKDLVDIDRLRILFEEFSRGTGFTTGFISYPDQEILIATGWRDICTKYHRNCPASAAVCRESNLFLTACLRDSRQLSIKPCGNGMVDGATPVLIRGRHLASVATGQVLFKTPDLVYFKSQAKKYGYDEEAYLAEIRKVPVVSERQLKQVLRFLSSLARFVAEEGLNTLRVGRSTILLRGEINLRRKSEQELLKSEEKFRMLFQGSMDAIIISDAEGRVLDCNESAILLFKCQSKADLLFKQPADFSPARQADGRDSKAASKKYADEAVCTGGSFFEWLLKKCDDTVFPAEVRLSSMEIGRQPILHAVIRDISTRKEAEQAILGERDRAQRYLDTVEAIIVALDAGGRINVINKKGCKLLGYNAETELVGLPWFSVCLPQPDGMERIFPFFLRLMKGELDPFEYFENPILTRQGELRQIAWHNSLLKDEHGNITGVLSAGEDVTERKRSEENVVRSNRALKTIDECNAAVLRAQSEQELLEEICRIIVETGGYKMAWVGIGEHDNNKTVKPVACAGVHKGFLEKARITWGDTIYGNRPAGIAIRTGTASICHDSQKARFSRRFIRDAKKYGWASAIGLPLPLGEDRLGMLAVYSGQPDAFGVEQQLLLDGFVRNLMAGIILIRTRAEREELQEELLRISEQMQQRLGQELHDDLGQQLTGMTLIAGVMEKKLRESGSPHAAEIRELLEMLSGATSATRALAHGLYPVELDPGGLPLALENLAARTSLLPEVKCRFIGRAEISLDPSHAIHLYRIAQEAVSNAVKHGRAGRITIDLSNENGSVMLAIESDGISFKPPRSNNDGLGLKIMKYRAQLIGAAIDISRRGKSGCRVVCRLP